MREESSPVSERSSTFFSLVWSHVGLTVFGKNGLTSDLSFSKCEFVENVLRLLSFDSYFSNYHASVFFYSFSFQLFLNPKSRTATRMSLFLSCEIFSESLLNVLLEGLAEWKTKLLISLLLGDDHWLSIVEKIIILNFSRFDHIRHKSQILKMISNKSKSPRIELVRLKSNPPILCWLLLICPVLYEKS